MKGTIISIIIGALLGIALTLGSSVRASHAAAASRHAEPIDAVSTALPSDPLADDSSTPTLRQDLQSDAERASPE
jgi:hypothetical protein